MTMPFLCAMLALLTLGVGARLSAVAGTAVVLIANWGTETAFYGMTGDQHAWMLYIVVDYLSALVLLLICSTRWQAAVIAIYAAQIVMHAAYGLSSMDAWAAFNYWWALTYGGWAQLFVTAGGGVACLLRVSSAGLRVPSFASMREALARRRA